MKRVKRTVYWNNRRFTTSNGGGANDWRFPIHNPLMYHVLYEETKQIILYCVFRKRTVSPVQTPLGGAYEILIYIYTTYIFERYTQTPSRTQWWTSFKVEWWYYLSPTQSLASKSDQAQGVGFDLWLRSQSVPNFPNRWFCWISCACENLMWNTAQCCENQKIWRFVPCVEVFNMLGLGIGSGYLQQYTNKTIWNSVRIRCFNSHMCFLQ